MCSFHKEANTDAKSIQQASITPQEPNAVSAKTKAPTPVETIASSYDPIAPSGLLKPDGALPDVIKQVDFLDMDAAGMLVPVKVYSGFAVGRPCVFVGPARTEAGRVIERYGAGCVVAQGMGAELAAAIAHLQEDREAWKAAHEGAVKAASVYLPGESMKAWVERAWAVVADDL